MTLKLKFNIALGSIFVFGLLVTSFITNKILHTNAKNNVIERAGLMMESATAVRTYTVEEVKPLIKDQLEETFHPQSVPSYAATTNFNMLRKNYPEYSYKEATLNPTNPKDRAVDWETDIITQFGNDTDLKQIVGERETPTGLYLYLAKPIRITNADCLVCHSVPGNAPKSMIDKYGDSNGFGWKMNEVVGSKIVSVPLSLPIKQANDTLKTFITCYVLVFMVCFLFMNFFISFMIMRPMKKMLDIADHVSNGELDADEFEDTGGDEISQLGGSFNRMRRSLEKAMSMIDEDDDDE
ncbi:MAG: DUF3365 domain-containing protein [Lentisphaeria bacterium]|nr:DUF3365 domain-containing protein [Lentisphaeria bacterium]